MSRYQSKTTEYLKILARDTGSQVITRIFFLGIVVYMTAYALSTTTRVNYIACQAAQSLGILTFVISGVKFFRVRFESSYLKVIFVAYGVWTLTIISRGNWTDYVFIKEMLFDAFFGIFPYLTPLLLFLPRKLASYKAVFNTIVILGLFYLFLSILFVKDLTNRDLTNLTSQAIIEYFAKTLSIPSTFLLLTYAYHSGKRRAFAWMVSLATLVFAVVRARRGMIIMFTLPIMIAIATQLYSAKTKWLKLLATITLLCMGALYGNTLFTESSFFNSLKERGVENTRAKVEDCYYADLTTRDWIIGKGIDGKYFCPGIDPGDYSSYRKTMETDFLHIILKGGLVYLILLMLILLPAIWKGLFQSRNMLSRSAALWIVLWIFSLYPSNVHTFTFNYILVWIAVGICYSPSIRSLPDNVVQAYFRTN